MTETIIEWNELSEKRLHSILRRAELTPKQSAIIESGIWELKIKSLRDEWDAIDSRIKALLTPEGLKDRRAQLLRNIGDCKQELQELESDEGIKNQINEYTNQVAFIEKAIFELEEKIEKLRSIMFA